MPLSVSDILDSDEPVQPVRLMSYGPIDGEHTRATNYGPQGNQLGPQDVAVSPDTGFNQGDILDIGDGVYRRAADASYFSPGRPTSHTIELRDKTDQGSGLAKRVTVGDILGPDSQPTDVGPNPPPQAIPSPTLSQEVGPPQATDARTQHAIDSRPITSQRDLEDIAASLPGYQQSQQAAANYNTAPPDLLSQDTVRKGLRAIGSIGATGPQDLQEGPTQSAMNDVIARNVAGFTNVNSLVTLPAYELRLVRMAAALQAGKGAYDAFQEGGPAGYTQGGIDAAMALLLGKSTLPEGSGAPVAPKDAAPEAPPVQAPEAAPAVHPSQALVDAIQAELEKANASIGKPMPEGPRVSPETGQVFYPETAPTVQGETARFGAVDTTPPDATIPNAAQAAPILRPEQEAAQGAETTLAPGGTQDTGALERQNVPTQGESSRMAVGATQETGEETGAPTSGESLGVTGVSRAARDAAGEVDRTPAAILSAQDHVQNGARLESQGADPVAAVQDAVDRGSFSRDATDLAIKRDADLTAVARQARRAADQAPGNRVLSLAADAAEKAQQHWEDYAIRPIRGQFADTGMSLQTAIDLDTGDYVDYRKQFAKQNAREPTPQEAAQLQGATRTARKLSDANSADLALIEKAAKPKRIMNRDELRDSLSKTKAQALADCIV